MTQRAIEFMETAKSKGEPWCAHLSFIKPHWPYIVPAPYHNMYGEKDILPVVRSNIELVDPHPIYSAFTEERHARNMSRAGVRERVIPAYMGLIKQIDDHLGKLFTYLEDSGQADNTVIVFTSDHGDYLGDHWLGEKYMFHDPSVKVPLIIYDPSPEADTTRGSTQDALVEMIDLAPTFLEMAGGEARPHILEGKSLCPLLKGEDLGLERKYVFSEYDFSFDPVRLKLGTPPQSSRMTMVFDGRYKLVDCRAFRPILFDLENDPKELVDLGDDSSYADVRTRLLDAIRSWYHDGRNRITMSDDAVMETDALRHEGCDPDVSEGILIGYWGEAELQEEKDKLADKYEN